MYSSNLLRDIISAWRGYALYSQVIPYVVTSAVTNLFDRAPLIEDRWNTSFFRYIDDHGVFRIGASSASVVEPDNYISDSDNDSNASDGNNGT